MHAQSIIRIFAVSLLLLLMVGTVGADTLIVRTTSATDAMVGKAGGNNAYSDLHVATGTDTSNDEGTVNIQLRTLTTSNTNTFYSLNTGNLQFDTSGVGAGNTVTGAKLSLCYYDKNNPFGSNAYGITNITPTTYGSTVVGDYQRRTSGVRLANDILYASLGATTWDNWTFWDNATGFINKTGFTAIAVRDNWDIDNSFTGTWAESSISTYRFWAWDYSSGERAPILTITYTSGTPPDTTPPASISGLANTTTCSSANFTYNNPGDADFNGTEYWLNGALQSPNLTKTNTFKLFSGLAENTAYTFSTKTFDNSSNINETFVNMTATTSLCDRHTVIISPEVMSDIQCSLSGGQTIADIRSACAPANIGNYPGETTGYGGMLRVISQDNPKFYTDRRMYMLFNFTNISAYWNITAANLTTTLYLKATSSLGSMPSGVISFTPLVPETISAGDWNNASFTELATQIPYASQTEGSPVIFTFGAAGTSLINSKIGSRLPIALASGDDISGTFTGSWAQNTISYSRFYMNWTGYIPHLTMTYISTAPPVSAFSVNKTIGRSPLTVAFTDSSSEYPTGWSWAYKNATVGWTIFSTSQNPVYSFPNGVYDINLTVTNDYGNGQTVKTSYISSITSWPAADFFGTPTTGVKPLTVTFTDSSDAASATSYAWTFGDGNTTNNSVQNPVHTYLGPGTYTVSMTVVNATGSDTKTRVGYIVVPTIHPVTFNVQQSPGYLNNGTEPWADAKNGTFLLADSGLTINYVTSSTSSSPGYAEAMAIAYQIGGDTKYVNKTVEALLSSTTLDITDADTCEYFGDYAIAYDQIYQTLNVNSTLTTANNTLIRDRLAYLTDTCYYRQNESYVPAYISLVDYHALSYFSIATTGLVLSDYSNSSQVTTPTDWANLGGDGLWVYDPIHTYGSTTTGNHGLMTEGFNYNSGASMIGAYKYYIDEGLYKFANIWSNVKGANYLDTYPPAKLVGLGETWQVLPMNVMPNAQTDGNIRRVTAKMLYGLMDDANRSILKRAIDNQESSNVILNMRYLGNPDDINTYLFVGNYSAIALNPPTYTSALTNDGYYQVLRKDWTNQSEWLSFVTWKYSVSSTRQYEHPDQLAFEYASHGDLLMPDSGESKFMPGVWSIYEGDAGNHNTLLFGNGTVNWTRSVPLNVTYRGIIKDGLYYDPGIIAVNVQTPANTTVIKTPSFEYIAGAITNIAIVEDIPREGTNYPAILSNNITYSRAIAYPLKDYMIVIDRAASPGNHDYINVFRFGSLMIHPNTTPINPTTLSGIGYVNGSLSINGSSYDWVSRPVAVESDIVAITNSVHWNTTSPYNDNTSLELFTAPASPVTQEKYFTRISTYDPVAIIGDIDSVAVPQVYFAKNQNTSLYRVTVLLSMYANGTARTPSELAVTGTGSAIKIINSTGGFTDYVYTGFGNATFGNFSTDADTLFIRNGTTNKYFLVNGTYFTDYGVTIFTNATQQTSTDLVSYGTASSVIPTVSFTADRWLVRVPGAVNFTDTSGNTPTSWLWSFGDGQANITTQNVTHKYIKRGYLPVCLNATNAAGSNTTCSVVRAIGF